MIAFGTGRKTLIALGVSLLLVAVGLHAFGFITQLHHRRAASPSRTSSSP